MDETKKRGESKKGRKGISRMDEKDRKIDQLYTELLETQNEINYQKARADYFEQKNKRILEIKKAETTGN